MTEDDTAIIESTHPHVVFCSDKTSAWCVLMPSHAAAVEYTTRAYDGIIVPIRVARAGSDLLAACKDLLAFGVEMDDERLGYVVAQIDRRDIEAAEAAIAKATKGTGP
jgi:hypothetical protein